MEDLCKLDNLEIDISKITPVEDVCETLMLSEELLEKYKIVIDESKIEKIIDEKHTQTCRRIPCGFCVVSKTILSFL